ncbi:MAG: hypothetical protein R2749_30465 [Acidimicrobiales bacterium]
MKADNGVVKLYNPAGTTHVVLDLVSTYVLDNGGGDTSAATSPSTGPGL